MERNIFDMSIHGFEQKAIDKYRRSCEKALRTTKKKKVVTLPIAQFQHQGLSIGRDNKTKVKR